MTVKKQTPNVEPRTPNAEWKAASFRIYEGQAEYPALKKTKYDLEDRLLDAAVAVVELTDDLPNTTAALPPNPIPFSVFII